MHSISNRIFEIHIFALLTSRRKFQNVTDRLTKTTHFIPIHTTYSAERYVEIYVELIVRLHGVPKTILSERGTQFVARFWAQVHESLGTKLIHSSSYHPQTDGQTKSKSNSGGYVESLRHSL
jgi:hypothetical protein